jgi:hypothetical protein
MPTLNQLLDRIASLPPATQALPEVDDFKNKLLQLKRSPQYDQVAGLLRVEVPDNLKEILNATV